MATSSHAMAMPMLCLRECYNMSTSSHAIDYTPLSCVCEWLTCLGKVTAVAWRRDGIDGGDPLSAWMPESRAQEREHAYVMQSETGGKCVSSGQ